MMDALNGRAASTTSARSPGVPHFGGRLGQGHQYWPTSRPAPRSARSASGWSPASSRRRRRLRRPVQGLPRLRPGRHRAQQRLRLPRRARHARCVDGGVASAGQRPGVRSDVQVLHAPAGPRQPRAIASFDQAIDVSDASPKATTQGPGRRREAQRSPASRPAGPARGRRLFVAAPSLTAGHPTSLSTLPALPRALPRDRDLETCSQVAGPRHARKPPAAADSTATCTPAARPRPQPPLQGAALRPDLATLGDDSRPPCATRTSPTHGRWFSPSSRAYLDATAAVSQACMVPLEPTREAFDEVDLFSAFRGKSLNETPTPGASPQTRRRHLAERVGRSGTAGAGRGLRARDPHGCWGAGHPRHRQLGASTSPSPCRCPCGLSLSLTEDQCDIYHMRIEDRARQAHPGQSSTHLP